MLLRHPHLVLVDELAHTNAPGLRHAKRHQDVDEILAAGIDVYTTLNIQHLESLNDVIAQITGIKVRETIPDSVIDESAEIELTDLPPEELLARLQDGKVYVPEQAVQAIEKFFRKGNLTALRELTLRRAAERVDDQMLVYMKTKAIPGPWPAAERLLVGISAHPLAERLVRSTRRLAGELNAVWSAVYVETTNQSRLSSSARDRIARTLHLAEELGGRSTTLPGNSVSDTLLRYAREHNVTKIIVGKPLRPRWKEILLGSVVDQLVRQCGNIDVFIISGETEVKPLQQEAAWQPHRPLRRYLWAVLVVLAATWISSFFHQLISPTNLVMVYLLAVVFIAVNWGRGPSILASFLSVIGFDFFFVPPYLTFAVSDSQYLLTFIALFAVGLIISELTARVRDQAKAAQRREADTAALYALSRDLSFRESLDDVIGAVSENVGQKFGREAAIFLPETEGSDRLKPYTQSPHFIPNDQEIAVAGWTFQHGQQAGRGTDTLSASEGRYIPLKTPRGVVGVLGIKPLNSSSFLTSDQRLLLETFATQAALAIERVRLAEQAQQTQILQATEKLQTALLNSISHDLRTPLVSITGALSSLSEGGPAMDAEIHRNLLDTAREEADRMNHLVGNLLNMTRLEAGAMHAVMQPCDIQDAIGTALEDLADRLNEREVSVDIDENMPLIPMDFVLIVQVLVNLIDNSLKFSRPDLPVAIRANHNNQEVVITVSDRGIGIPTEDLDHIFEKFYRVQRPENVGGTGLGLSICKGIVESHDGRIWAENRPGGGTILTFTLPLKNQPEGQR